MVLYSGHTFFLPLVKITSATTYINDARWMFSSYSQLFSLSHFIYSIYIYTYMYIHTVLCLLYVGSELNQRLQILDVFLIKVENVFDGFISKYKKAHAPKRTRARRHAHARTHIYIQKHKRLIRSFLFLKYNLEHLPNLIRISVKGVLKESRTDTVFIWIP